MERTGAVKHAVADQRVDVIGLQWQFTGTSVGGDAGPACPIDVTITIVKFVP